MAGSGSLPLGSYIWSSAVSGVKGLKDGLDSAFLNSLNTWYRLKQYLCLN